MLECICQLQQRNVRDAELELCLQELPRSARNQLSTKPYLTDRYGEPVSESPDKTTAIEVLKSFAEMLQTLCSACFPRYSVSRDQQRSKRGMLALRRPVLAQPIAASCPSISVIRSFNYRDGNEMLQVLRAARPNDASLEKPRATVWAVLQYLVVLACLGNLVHAVWQLSNNTINTVRSQSVGWPIFWACVALPIHWAGFYTVRKRVRLVSESNAIECSYISKKCSYGRRARSWVKNEYRLDVYQPPHSATLKMRVETWQFSLSAWMTATASLLHLLFGTIVLSSVLFVSITDAILVTSRLLLSVFVSQGILAYELYGMRCLISVSDECVKEKVDSLAS